MTNIALVVLDTLRKDAFDRHFDWLPGRRFERAFSTANWTVPSHASLFTGEYPSEVGVHSKNMYLNCSESVLAEQLSEVGYTTRAFSANTNVTPHFDFGRGFSDFRGPDQHIHLIDDNQFDWRAFIRATNSTGVRKYFQAVYEIATTDVKTVPSLITGVKQKLSDNPTGVKYGGTLEAMEEFRNTDFGKQEFIFINVMEAHEPYQVPKEYMTVEESDLTDSVGNIRFGSVDKEQIRQAYDDCAKYLSDIYNNLFNVLSKRFDYIITVSDHGEMLGEHDALGHEHGVHRELTHIPLCIYGDGMDGTCTETVNLCDIYETILDIAGIEHSGGRGQTLLGDIEGRECITEYLGLTSWSEQKLEENGYENELEQYDRELHGYAAIDEYYGYETIDGFEETGGTQVESPQERLASLVSELNVRDVERDNDVPDEIKDRLEDLGYA
jgi:arylsulfatase A-like enzyme